MPQRPSPQVIALVRDLIFASKISAAAARAGVVATILRDPAQLADQITPLLLADLNQPGALEAASRWKQTHPGQVVGFVSHVDTQKIQQARAAGFDQVLARSGFVQALPQLLAAIKSDETGQSRAP